MADTGAILTGGTNNFNTTSEMLNYHATDMFSDGPVGTLTNTAGVAPMTGTWAVNAQGSPNMTVAVTAGPGYVTTTPTSQGSQRLRAAIATQNVTIAANSTGGTRYDWIYVTGSAPGAANPAADGTGVFSVTTSRSTSNTVDNGTPPTYGYNTAIVTVANGAVSITNGNIADKRVQSGASSSAKLLSNPYKFAAYRSAAYTSVSATQTKMPLDTKEFDTGSNFDSSTNYRFTAPVAGYYFFSARFGVTATRAIAYLYKNGSEIRRGDDQTTASTNTGVQVNSLLSLAAGDYVEFWYYTASAVSVDATTANNTYFNGFLVSTT